MTRTIQILRGTKAQNDAFTGAAGELTMDTTTNQIRVHDGSTAGGHKMKADAVINSNTANGATGLLYNWVGTLAEYTTQNIETLHPDWVCLITDDASATAYDAYSRSQSDDLFVAKAHEVIAFQAPNASNNYTWYRKYADGWVEQGGYSGAGTAATNDSPIVSIPLLVEMADTNYTAIANATFGGGSGWNGPFKTGSSTTTEVKFAGWVSGTSTMYIQYWEVKGMAA